MNRFLLALIGVVLLVGGLAVVGRSQGRFEDLLRSPGKPMITTTQAERLVDHNWWWPVVIGVPATLLVIALWWFLAQFRRRPVRTIFVYGDGPEDSGPSRLGTGFGLVGDDADTLTVQGRSLGEAIAGDIDHIPGVEHANVRLLRHRNGPRLRISILAEPGAEPREVLTAVGADAVEDACSSVGLPDLPARVVLRGARGLPKRKLD